MMPAPRLLAALGVWALVALIVTLGWLPLLPWVLLGAALFVAVLIDALAVWRVPAIEIERVLPTTLALGRRSEIGLRLRCGGSARLEAWAHDHHPGDWPAEGLPRRVDLRPGHETEIVYRLRPTGRGTAQFDGCALRIASPWRLWMRQRRMGPVDQVRVYPDFAPLARFALISAERVSLATGVHLQRRRGEGTDFHQLRDFRIGDSLRQVDWKATARLKRPISRQYQEERDQQIVVALDTGRCMLAQDDELAHFDHALNAVLVLAYIALRQGDAVGLMSGGGASSRWLPPQRGGAAINILLNSLYDLQAKSVPTDFVALASELASRQRRRALVVLVTNLRDEASDEVTAAAALLAQRHLVCIASLREKALDQALDDPPADFGGALLAGGAAHYLAARRRSHDRLRQTGATLLDVNCDALPKALTETYLAIKRSGRL